MKRTRVVDGRKERILFPETYATIVEAKRVDIPAADVWSTMKRSLAETDMQPSAKAAAAATYYEYILDIYGITAKELPL